MKKRRLLLLFTILLTTGLFAQESITNIVVNPKTDGTGIVDVYYDLSGPESSYTITLEASLDGGTNYTPVDNICISGDIGSVTPGTGKYLIWDGICTYPETYSTQSKINIIATYSAGPGTPCPGAPTVTDIDGNTYNTVLIGTQCWMAENMNLESGNSWCYDDDPTNCDTYGRLYDWETALSVCPGGWHLPSDEEWKILEGTVDSQYPVGDPEWNGVGEFRGFDAGLNLKSTSGWNSNGTGLYGFGAMPGGFRSSSSGSFNYLGIVGYWRSSSAYSSTYAWGRGLHTDIDGSFRVQYRKTYGFSARCIKN